MIQRTLEALCDPTRRAILKMLKRGQRTVGEIGERFDVSAPAISRHLAVLRDCGLVLAERRGKFIYYSISPDGLVEVRDWLNDFLKDCEEWL